MIDVRAGVPPMMKSVPNKRKIFFAILLLAVGFVVISGTRWLVSGRTRAALSSCIAQLKQIDGAKSTWALEHQKTADDVPSDSDLFGAKAYIAHKPVCPRGGTYAIGKVGEYARCTIPHHSLDYGRVIVIDETGKPVIGAEISVQAYSYETTADGGSYAPIATIPKWIIVSKAGYNTARVEIPKAWPLAITLKSDQ